MPSPRRSFGPVASDPRTLWLSRRARNVSRHPIFLASISLLAFVAALIALVLTPRGAQRIARRVAPAAAERPDTSRLLAERQRAAELLRGSEAAIGQARLTIAERSRPPEPVDTLSPVSRARRDSLAALNAQLGPLLARAQSAPLPASYRALGAASALATEPRVRALLDSLAEIERNREAFGAIGGVDPIFVALTARATEIGRAIQDIGIAKRAELRRELDRLRPVVLARAVDALPVVDTTPLLAARDSARAVLDRAERDVARARLIHHEIDQRERRAREIASVSASPSAMLGAAIILGLAVGFAVALLNEIRRPRVADAREAEQVAGVMALARVQAQEPPPERTRRRVDRQLPPVIDQVNDSYRLLYFQLADGAANLPRMAVLADHAGVAIAVAANLAAAAANQARSAILVDVDMATCAAASLLRVRAVPGLADVLARRVGWPEAIVPALIGRDRTIDVMPSGSCRPAPAPVVSVEQLDTEVSRLGRRYDTVVLGAVSDQRATAISAARSVGGAIVCVRLGQTPIGELRQLMADLRAAGVESRGVVSWEMDEPALSLPDEAPTAAEPAESTYERART